MKYTQRNKQQEAADRSRRAVVALYLCDSMAADAILRAATSGEAMDPGSWSNTVLNAFVSTKAEPWESRILIRHLRVRWSELRQVAWAALAGRLARTVPPRPV